MIDALEKILSKEQIEVLKQRLVKIGGELTKKHLKWVFKTGYGVNNADTWKIVQDNEFPDWFIKGSVKGRSENITKAELKAFLISNFGL